MVDAQSALKRSGLTRGKAAAIGALAAVLIGVLYMQFGSSGAEPSSDPVAYRPRRPVPAPAANQSQKSAAEKKGQTENGAPAAVAAIVDAETRRVARQEGLGAFVNLLRAEVGEDLK